MAYVGQLSILELNQIFVNENVYSILTNRIVMFLADSFPQVSIMKEQRIDWGSIV